MKKVAKEYLSGFIELEKVAKPGHVNRDGIAIDRLAELESFTEDFDVLADFLLGEIGGNRNFLKQRNNN